MAVTQIIKIPLSLTHISGRYSIAAKKKPYHSDWSNPLDLIDYFFPQTASKTQEWQDKPKLCSVFFVQKSLLNIYFRMAYIKPKQESILK